MLVQSTAEIVPCLFRCVALSRVYTPLGLSRTAVRFLPSLSCLAPGQRLSITSNSIQFVRGLSRSSAASFHVTNWICDGSERDTTTGSSASSVSAAESKMSQGERLKRAVKEYGATVIVFHTCLSLFTLGISYAAVSRWLIKSQAYSYGYQLNSLCSVYTHGWLAY